MVLENKKGLKKEFKLLLKMEMNDKKYLIYEDPETNNVYAGEINKDELKKVDDLEVEVLEKLVERIDGK